MPHIKFEDIPSSKDSDIKIPEYVKCEICGTTKFNAITQAICDKCLSSKETVNGGGYG